MVSPAAHRLHVVVLSADEIAEQEERGRDAISFAADRDVEGPGLGRVAIVFSRDERGIVISHLGAVKAANQRTNLDRTWVVSSLAELAPPIALTDILADLGGAADEIRRAAESRRGGGLSGAVSDKLREVLVSRLGEENWPDIGTPEWMRDRLDGGVRQDYTNAVGTALMFSDMDIASVRTVPLPGGSPLTTLRVQPPEASLIDHDLRNFPGMAGTAVAEDIVRVTDGQHTLDIMNVNTAGFETAVGVDLVYYNHDYESFVLVQYKRMDSGNGSRIASVDSRLPRQLTKMSEFDAFAAAAANLADPDAYRLNAAATYTKFAAPAAVPIRESDLTRGIYVPSEFLKRLYDAGVLIGPDGGQAVTYDNLGRWLANGLFADLVSKGWVGTSGLSVDDVAGFVAERLRSGRHAVVAAHSSSRAVPGTSG